MGNFYLVIPSDNSVKIELTFSRRLIFKSITQLLTPFWKSKQFRCFPFSVLSRVSIVADFRLARDTEEHLKKKHDRKIQRHIFDAVVFSCSLFEAK